MPKRRRGFGLGALTPQGQKKISDYIPKSIRSDDDGNDTLDLNGVRNDGEKVYGLSCEIN